MRLRALLFIFFVATSPAYAMQAISEATLDQTMLKAQTALDAGEYASAFALYQTAAEWGHKGAQYVLGELYLQGKGVPQNPVMAYAWLDVAAEAPDRDFRKAKDRAANSLTPEQMTEATAMAKDLSDKYGLEAAGVKCRKEARIGSNIKVVNCYHSKNNSGELLVPDVPAASISASAM